MYIYKKIKKKKTLILAISKVDSAIQLITVENVRKITITK